MGTINVIKFFFFIKGEKQLIFLIFLKALSEE